MSNLPLFDFQVKPILGPWHWLIMGQLMNEKAMNKAALEKSNKAKKVKPGIRDISLFMLFQALQSTTPKLASLMAYHLWFHPGRKSLRSLAPFKPEDSVVSRMTINAKTVVYWRAGKGPLVLLVHGWASAGKQLATLAQSFIDQGFSVIWFDAPAHGESTGWQTSLFEISQTICEIQQREGEFKVVIAHSFGVPCSLLALQKGLKTQQLIAISSPSTASGLIDKFCKIIKANSRTQQYLSRRIDRFLGEMSIEEIAAENMVKDLEHKCLVIHDKHDRMIRSSEGRAVHNNLRHSTFFETQRLGHNKVLNDPQVIEKCLEFVLSD